MPNYSGVWTLQQQLQAKAQGLWPINGPFYIEEMFSTTLYTGNGTTQTITNGIDLAGKGGLVWAKDRTSANSNWLYDTLRGVNASISSNLTNAQGSVSGVNAFNANGFGIGTNGALNTSNSSYASWAFRKQSKFFDIVTYTGDGTSNRLISHNLNSVPGCVIVKCTSTARPWSVAARAEDSTYRYLALQDTGAQVGSNLISTYATSTTFNLTAFTNGGQPLDNVNTNGATYVAYLFAHDAGGFGTTGADNVISCGSYTGNGISNGPTVTLGYEPQFLIVKRATGGPEDWVILDNMRGWTVSSDNPRLSPNLTAAETNSANAGITSTGFKINGTIANINASGSVYIYIAVRRGPMKVPTLATTVFGISARTGTGANATVTGGTGVDDAVLIKNRGAAVGDLFASRLTGTGYLETSATTAEVAAGATILQANPWDVMDGVKVGTTSTITNASANTFVNYLFSRAPGFMDVVSYTGTGANTTQAHNLAIAPEMMIVKKRSSATGSDWFVYHSGMVDVIYPNPATQYIVLNSTSDRVRGASGAWNNTQPTSSVFSLGDTTYTNASGQTFVAYLFATVAGVSKVGSYTGTAALQTVACGFAAGARFVMIKRTDAVGDWYYWDSVRGITSGNDPYLLMNTAAAEVTGTNYVDTDTTGFKVTAAAPAALNAVGGTYIFLAIA